MSHLDKTIKHYIPDYLFKDLKYPESAVLTPGEIYGADRLWAIIVSRCGGDPLEMLFELKHTHSIKKDGT